MTIGKRFANGASVTGGPASANGAEVTTARLILFVTGVVQGVGFRPFAHRLAESMGVTGRVRNEGARVRIDVEGEPKVLAVFVERLRTDCPAVADIEQIDVESAPPEGYGDFQIVSSAVGAKSLSFGIPADLAICADCLRDMRTPGSRYYRYPFTSCTQCGPRYTAAKSLPFDRQTTVMDSFPLCDECLQEYTDVQSRRFHAQATACAVCGPELQWLAPDGRMLGRGEDALKLAQETLRAGGIAAVLGIGGFHLAASAQDEGAVALLRQRKRRPSKPFAVMMTEATLAEFCVIDDAERGWLTSKEHPILLVHKRADADLAPGVAPYMNRYGVFLPYTGVHVLLTSDEALSALVMTSGNVSGEPLAFIIDDGLRRLGAIADGFLVHNRPIMRPVDDSILRIDGGAPHIIRRSRGFAPQSDSVAHMGKNLPPLLALGGDLKNAFAVSDQGKLWLGPYGGDLAEPLTLAVFQEQVEWYLSMLRVRPEFVVYDPHPGYVSQAYAKQRFEAKLRVQHHHAHMAATMLEHCLSSPALGIILDGTGYGDDGAVWGGEFLIGGLKRVERVGHLRSVRMISGDHAVREPWRLVLNYLYELGLWEEFAPFVAAALELDEKQVTLTKKALGSRLPGYRSSSAGRLFDVVGVLVTGQKIATFESELPLRLEAYVTPTVTEGYEFPVVLEQGGWLVELQPGLRQLLADLRRNAPRTHMAAKFHRGFCAALVEAAQRIAAENGIRDVVLGGGVWQNPWLLHWFAQAAGRAGLAVYHPVKWPANDGGLAAGQTAVALARLQGE
ncbi:MAG: carbamoyltransferase HypF [Bacilli bacterium]